VTLILRANNPGPGFFTDAYDLFAIGLVTAMLGVVYWHDAADPSKRGLLPEHSETAIKVATSGGTVIGQVGFGILADVVGRKKMYGFELILIIFTTLAQALSSDSWAISITGIIIFWRVMMGVGIGGDCMLSTPTSCLKREVDVCELTHAVQILCHPSSLPNLPRPSGEEP
jgi:MFS transporter, PHS family, inorganic phosphate transporter